MYTFLGGVLVCKRARVPRRTASYRVVPRARYGHGCQSWLGNNWRSGAMLGVRSAATHVHGMHTRAQVTTAKEARVTGLSGLTYLDKSDDPTAPAEKTEDRDAITFGHKLVDSVYLDSPDEVRLEVGTGARCCRPPCVPCNVGFSARPRRILPVASSARWSSRLSCNCPAVSRA